MKQEWILRRSHSCRWLDTVFFGSTLTNFQVQTFAKPSSSLLQNYGLKKTDGELLVPWQGLLSGLSLKIQTNIWILVTVTASLCPYRIGQIWGRGRMSVNLPRTGKGAKLSMSQFMARGRENVTNAVAGDIIGVMIQYPTRLEIHDCWQKTSLRVLNHYQPSRLRFFLKGFAPKNTLWNKIFPQESGTVGTRRSHPAL